MNNVDRIYNELVKDIHNNGYSDNNMEVRAKYEDDTPAFCTSVFGKQVEFDKGVIPLLTGKKVFAKSAIKEMILFWVKQTVKEDDFRNDRVKIWDSWFKNGNLGRSYAYQFESRPRREIVEVTPIKKDVNVHGVLEKLVVGEKEKPNVDCKDYYIGKRYKTNRSGYYTVIDVIDTDRGKFAKLQFDNTNSITLLERHKLSWGTKYTITDKYLRTVEGVGYLGDYESVKNISETELKTLHTRWHSMIVRCYSGKYVDYNNYGGCGVFVDKRWHSFENFLRDVRYIPQYFIAKERNFNGFNLDKDYYGSNCYSKETCVWLTSEDNTTYATQKYIAKVKKGEDKEITYINMQEMARKYKISVRILEKLSRCKYLDINGVTFTLSDKNDIRDKLYRYKLSKNQVVDLIHNIKNNPTSKRLLTSFWNDADVNDKVLQECAWATNWRVAGDTLELILIQRSGDIGLGVPFNWFQYKILQMMIAHATGLKPGKFIHQVANLHYYDRHEETLLKQCENDTYDPPTITINSNVNDFFDFTVDDIIIEGYKCGEYLPMEVAI